jgi:nucleoside-diphosphate-sugar epimerase
MRYLVTGAAGFIGSKVAEFLLDDGHEVVGADNVNDAYDIRLKEWRLGRIRSRDNFRFVKMDLTDRAETAKLFQGDAPFDAVINLAARAGVRPSVENPWIYSQSNSDATLNLLNECVAHGVEKFVLSSTSSLYGGDNPMPYSETIDTSRPLSPYAASKKAAEVMCYTYHYLHGIDVTVFRYFTVYGPAGRPDMAPFRFVQWIAEGEPVQVFGDGRQGRDFTYVDDVARGTILGLRKVGYEVINLGSDKPFLLIDLIRVIEEKTGRQANLVYSAPHKADVRATWADISKAQTLLGWQPQIGFEDGVGRLVEWYRDNREWAKLVETRKG